MSVTYYDNSTNTIVDGELVQSSDVEQKFNDVAAYSELHAQAINRTVLFTADDFTASMELAASAATRADKSIGFDADGNLALQGSPQEWAVKMTGPVEGSDYSAKYNASLAAAEAVAAAAEVASASAFADASAASAASAAAAAASTYEAAADFDVVSSSATLLFFSKTLVTGGSGITLTLPSGPTAGDWVTIKVTADAIDNPVTLSADESIEYDIDSIDQGPLSLTLVFDGALWRI
jgi:hypothetical protein